MLRQEKRVAAIGNFDGVHLGHQRILKRVCDIAKAVGGQPEIITFYPPPIKVLQPGKSGVQLMSFAEKTLALRAHGIQTIHRVRFNQAFRQLSPEAFIDETLINQCRISHCVIGEDFRFGYDKQGDVALLDALGQKKGLTCEAFPVEGPKKISSSTIRKALTAGDLVLAEKLLGRPFSIMGRVNHGQKRGRLMGIPTANIPWSADRVDLQGTFIVKATIGDATFPGVANVGNRPTVAGQQKVCEVHIFDFAKDIYGQRIEVTFLKKLRNEKKFENINALKQQIQQDMLAGRTYFDLQS